MGYLKFDCFAPAEFAGSTAVAAMGFLAGSDALIFDVRDNGGGSPSMIQLLISYLVGGERTHLNNFYIRKGDKTEQFWTQSWVPGTRLPDVPVFVLTSGRTFSAAEEFTYDLKNLKRATLVGETDGRRRPSGRRVSREKLSNLREAALRPGGQPDQRQPTGREPGSSRTSRCRRRTRSTWRTSRALAAVAEKATDPEQKASLEFVRKVLEDRSKPATLSAADLQAYAGTYGPRSISLENGALWYQRGKNRKMRLLPVGQDRFLVGDMEDFRIASSAMPTAASSASLPTTPAGQEEPERPRRRVGRGHPAQDPHHPGPLLPTRPAPAPGEEGAKQGCPRGTPLPGRWLGWSGEGQG